ncbi:MAG: hypothetical protein P4K94_01225 [Terracidiphilus sp.]|nr:hypothetical protein [Terracidiphilus sp.]
MTRKAKPRKQGLLVAGAIAFVVLLLLLRLFVFVHGHGRHRHRGAGNGMHVTVASLEPKHELRRASAGRTVNGTPGFLRLIAPANLEVQL